MNDKEYLEEIFDPDSGDLLHKVIRPRLNKKTVSIEREDFSNPSEFLQGAVMHIPSMYSFKPHVHLDRSRSFENLRAQESWIVIDGHVEVDYFSEKGALIETKLLSPGDISVTFRGGHGYKTLNQPALVYEFKSGPYEGQEVDKRFI